MSPAAAKPSKPAGLSAAAELLVGGVMHERLRPRRRRFVYPVFALRVDLARLDELNNRWFGVDCHRPLSLHRADHGPRDGSCLLTWIRGILQEAGLPHDGAVHLQTFPRVLGYGFNPVSFWYCHDAQGQLHGVLAEVNNTFGEHHRYLLQADDAGPITGGNTLSCRKVLHVSPFCRVEGNYQFRFRDGTQSRFVGIDYHDDEGLLLRTSLQGRPRPFTPAELRRCLLRQPLLTLGVIARIHWQALRLWLGRVPFHAKPAPPSVTLSHASVPGARAAANKETL